MDRGAQWASVHRVAKSQTLLKQFSTRTRTHTHTLYVLRSQVALVAKNSPADAGDSRDGSLIPRSKSPGVGIGNLFQYFCLEDPHGQWSLVGYNAWGHKELDKTKAQPSNVTLYIFKLSNFVGPLEGVPRFTVFLQILSCIQEKNKTGCWPSQQCWER